MIESEIAYVLDALRAMDGTLWNTGCASSYFDASGRNTLWPDWTWRFRRRTSRFDPRHYRLRGGVAA
jgi:hypothetical protein